MEPIQIKDFNLGGIADSKYMGRENSSASLVGLDLHSQPGVLRVRNKLSADSGAPSDEFIWKFIETSTGEIYAFSYDSGKIWKVVNSSTYALVYTTSPTSGNAGCLGASEYEGYIYWATQNYLHRIPLHETSDWSEGAEPNWDELHLDQEELGYTGAEYLTPTSISDTNSLVQKNLTYALGEDYKIQKKLTYEVLSSHRLTFYPRNSILSGVAVNIKDKGTGNVTVTLHDEYNRSIASKTITNASLNSPEWNVFTFSSEVNVRKGEAYHIHITSTTGDAVVETSYNMYLERGNVKIYTSGSDEYHPMQIQNLVLYIGDRNFIHQVDKDPVTDQHVFSAWALDLVDHLKVKCLGRYITDLLIGTTVANDVNETELLRWNTWSVSYSATDPIKEQGINAIIEGDNFLLVSAGKKGRYYVYDGSQLRLYGGVPGVYDSDNRAVINPNAWSMYESLMIFGMSNSVGTPTKPGVYSYGTARAGFPSVLNLDFPTSRRESDYPRIQKPLTYKMDGEVGATQIAKMLTYEVYREVENISFRNIEVGAILVSGDTVLVSWRDTSRGSVHGVDRLDADTKLNGAFLETRMIYTSGAVLDNFKQFIANYVSLPSGTDILISYKNKHSGEWIPLPTIDRTRRNDNEREQIVARKTVKARVLQLKVTFLTDGEESPELESLVLNVE